MRIIAIITLVLAFQACSRSTQTCEDYKANIPNDSTNFTIINYYAFPESDNPYATPFL